MKTIKIFLNSICYLLAFLILFQGCTVYKKQNISLKEAANTNSKVKVITEENKTQKYLYIINKNGEYYGIKKINNKRTEAPLQQENLKGIRIKDKSTSNIYTAVLLGGITLIVAIVGISNIDIVDTTN